MTLSERLQAAAARLKEWAADLQEDIDAGYCLSDNDRVAEATRTAARVWPALAEQLRRAGVRAGNVYTDPISRRVWHQRSNCRAEVGVTCECFSDALELADLILGEVPGADPSAGAAG